MSWWYAVNAQKTGPVDIEVIKQFYHKGKLDSESLVWQDGMSNWEPLGKVAAFSDLFTSVPPPLPNQSTPPPINYSLATAWRRFFARMFDLCFSIFNLGLFLFIFFGSNWIAKTNTPQIILGFALIPFALFFDAVIYGVAGNTLGKALLGLNVVCSRGNPLRFPKYIQRNFLLWVEGIAFGLPLINLFTMTFQARRRIGKGLPTTYDQKLDCQVYSKPVPLWHLFVFFGLFLALFYIASLGWSEYLSTSEEGTGKVRTISVEEANAKYPSGWVDIVEYSPEYKHLIDLATSARDRNKSISLATQAIELDPNKPLAYGIRTIYKTVDPPDWLGVLEDSTKCINLNPLDAKYYYYLRGRAKAALGDEFGAMADWNTAIELAPDGSENPKTKGEVYYFRGLLRGKQGDDQGARQDLSIAGELGYTKAYDFLKSISSN